MTQIELGGQTIAAVSDERPLRVHIGSSWLFSAESTLTFVDENGATGHFEGDDPDAVSALSPLLTGRTIETAVIEDGAIRIAFADGAALTAAADPDYESWHVTGPDGLLVVSMPGGELAVWSAEESEP